MSQPRRNRPTQRGDGQPFGRAVPRWDRNTRRLTYRNILILEFRRGASSQLPLLDALEEDGWRGLSDDPHRPDGKVKAKSRLREAVKRLNRSQSTLHFFTRDGTAFGCRLAAKPPRRRRNA